MRGAGISFGVYLALLLLPAAVRAAEVPKDVDAIVRYFDTIVFGAELSGTRGSTIVGKWGPKVSMRVRNLKSEEIKKVLVRHLGTVSRLTKVKFDVFGGAKHKGRQADIDLLFMNKPEQRAWTMSGPGLTPEFVDRTKRSAPCFFFSWKGKAGRIARAVIVVNVDQKPEAIDHCLLEELTQVMGLPNDSNALRPSLFSDKDRLRAYAPVDKILIRTLYDPRMKAGLSRDRANAVAREIIRELISGRN